MSLLTFHENIAYTGTAAASATPLLVGQTYVIVATTACWYKQGPAGQAAVTASSGILLPAFVPYEIPCRNSQEVALSALQVTAGGTLNVARAN